MRFPNYRIKNVSELEEVRPRMGDSVIWSSYSGLLVPRESHWFAIYRFVVNRSQG